MTFILIVQSPKHYLQIQLSNKGPSCGINIVMLSISPLNLVFNFRNKGPNPNIIFVLWYLHIFSTFNLTISTAIECCQIMDRCCVWLYKNPHNLSRCVIIILNSFIAVLNALLISLVSFSFFSIFPYKFDSEGLCVNFIVPKYCNQSIFFYK